MTPRPIALRPDPTASRDAAVGSFVRAAIAIGLSARDKTIPASTVLRRQWGDDRTAELVLRAATSPSTLTGPLAQVATAFLDVLTPLSAGADLLQRGVQVGLDGVASIKVPGISLPNVGFVGESQPIPVYVETTSPGPSLSPHKLAAMVALTNELLAATSGEALVRQALIEAVAPALDAQLFSSNAADATRPAGLLAGIAPLTPAAAGAKEQAIVDDLQALALALSPVFGNGNMVIVASIDASIALHLRVPQALEWPVLTTSGLAARTVIAVASNAVVSALAGPPEVEASAEAAYVPDTVPTDIVTTPGVVASSVTTVFQTDKTLLKLRWPIAWALRDSRALAFMQLVNW
jgi:hypothetical protein